MGFAGARNRQGVVCAGQEGQSRLTVNVLLEDHCRPTKSTALFEIRPPRQSRSDADGLAKNGAMPSRASLSARIFNSLSAWPLTQRHSIA
jgi:hypothetical protein